jgi:two-component system LytT family response regulator
LEIHERTGFDLLKQVEKINFEVIFTTAYDKYAVQAFKFSAIDYLLKPIDSGDLNDAINKVQNKVAKNDTAAKLDTLFHNLNNMQGAVKKICVPVVSGLVFLDISEIIRCESDINYTTIYLKDKQKLVVAKTLKEFEEMLSEYSFFRIHNSHLINLAYVKSYNRGKGGSVILVDGTEVEVSTRRKDNFLKKMGEL